MKRHEQSRAGMNGGSHRWTHCKRGHPLEGDNLGQSWYRTDKGEMRLKRYCQTCKKVTADKRRKPSRKGPSVSNTPFVGGQDIVGELAELEHAYFCARTDEKDKIRERMEELRQ